MGEEAVLRRVAPVLNPKMLRSYLDKRYYKLGDKAQKLQRVGWCHPQKTASNSTEVERTVCRENEEMAGAQAGSFKTKLKEFAVYLEDEGKPLKDFKQGVPQSN